ncbi:MAG: hypothetical protein WBA87_18140, partial [Microbacterium sp.]
MSDIRRVDGGLVSGRFTDHHVHLQLVDHTLLPGSRLGRVVDLGGNPAVLRDLAHAARVERTGEGASEPAKSTRGAVIEYAGPFLTAPGGYPSDRVWAPAESVREIPDAASAATIVDEAAAAGASFIKVVMNSDAGPVLDDDSFRAVVSAAAAHG